MYRPIYLSIDLSIYLSTYLIVWLCFADFVQVPGPVVWKLFAFGQRVVDYRGQALTGVIIVFVICRRILLLSLL